MEVDVEAYPTAAAADGHRRDRGDLVTAVAMSHHRGLPPRRPRPPDVRDQQKAAFVEEHQVGLQVSGFFLICTQRYRFQRAMAVSSRSIARRSGFWHDQPKSLSTRPTWARWKRTPNARLMTAAIRSVVHSWVSKPHAEAPRSRSRGNCACCRAVNFGGRPDAG